MMAEFGTVLDRDSERGILRIALSWNDFPRNHSRYYGLGTPLAAHYLSIGSLGSTYIRATV